jgi:hypothetical protein
VINQHDPLISKLPLDVSPAFIIDYGASVKYPDDPTKIAIYIFSANPSNKHDAISSIYFLGYDPSDYEIVFKNIADTQVREEVIGD